MAEDSAPTPGQPARDGSPIDDAPEPHTVPSLPRRLSEPTPVVLAGTALWLLACVPFGVPGVTHGVWTIEFWTCVAGFGLGILGYGVFRWQRSASRRGSRGAWQGLSGLDG